MTHILRLSAWSLTMLLIGCTAPRQSRVADDELLWTKAESTAIGECQDSLRVEPTSQCHIVLVDGFLSAFSGASGQLTLARFWHVNAHQVDSAFAFQRQRLTTLLGPPKDTEPAITWNLNGSQVSLWQRGPDVTPVDSSQRWWAVVLIDGGSGIVSGPD